MSALTIHLGNRHLAAKTRAAWTRIAGYPRLVAGLTLLLLLVLAALLAPVLTHYGPDAASFSATMQGPSAAHVLGTDQLGRDVLSRALYGGQRTLSVSFATVAVSAVVGVALGLVSGYLGSWTDSVIMRVMDALLAFPGLVLALAITFVLGPSFTSVLAALSVVSIPRFARLVRGEVLRLKNRAFIDACRVARVSPVRVMGTHLLPNVTEVVVIQAALTGGQAIFTAASLSFLGLGLPPPAPSWGGMLKNGYPFLQVHPLLAFVPGVLIFMAMLGFNLAGDGLRDLFDPKTRNRVRRLPGRPEDFREVSARD